MIERWSLVDCALAAAVLAGASPTHSGGEVRFGTLPSAEADVYCVSPAESPAGVNISLLRARIGAGGALRAERHDFVIPRSGLATSARDHTTMVSAQHGHGWRIREGVLWCVGQELRPREHVHWLLRFPSRPGAPRNSLPMFRQGEGPLWPYGPPGYVFPLLMMGGGTPTPYWWFDLVPTAAGRALLFVSRRPALPTREPTMQVWEFDGATLLGWPATRPVDIDQGWKLREEFRCGFKGRFVAAVPPGEEAGYLFVAQAGQVWSATGRAPRRCEPLAGTPSGPAIAVLTDDHAAKGYAFTRDHFFELRRPVSARQFDIRQLSAGTSELSEPLKTLVPCARKVLELRAGKGDM